MCIRNYLSRHVAQEFSIPVCKEPTPTEHCALRPQDACFWARYVSVPGLSGWALSTAVRIGLFVSILMVATLLSGLTVTHPPIGPPQALLYVDRMPSPQEVARLDTHGL